MEYIVTREPLGSPLTEYILNQLRREHGYQLVTALNTGEHLEYIFIKEKN